MEHLNQYVALPLHLVKQKNMPAGRLRVLAAIISLCQREGYCWARQKYIAEMAGFSLWQTNRYIRALVVRKYLQSLRRGKTLTNHLRPGPALALTLRRVRSAAGNLHRWWSDLRATQNLRKTKEITSKNKEEKPHPPTPNQVDLWPPWLKDVAVRYGVM